MENRTSTAQADAFVPQNHPGRKKRAGANAEEKASACSARNDKFSFFGSVRGTVETVPSLWRAARLGVEVTQKSKADSSGRNGPRNDNRGGRRWSGVDLRGVGEDRRKQI